MAQQTINVGTSPNDGTGDFVRDAFIKTNDNFTELYDAGGASVNPTSGFLPYNNAGTFADSTFQLIPDTSFGSGLPVGYSNATNPAVGGGYNTLVDDQNSFYTFGSASTNISSCNAAAGLAINGNSGVSIIGCGMSSPTAGVFKAESSSGIIRIGTSDGEQIGVSPYDESMIIGSSLMNTTPPANAATAVKWANVVDGSGNAYKFPLYQ